MREQGGVAKRKGIRKASMPPDLCRWYVGGVLRCWQKRFSSARAISSCAHHLGVAVASILGPASSCGIVAPSFSSSYSKILVLTLVVLPCANMGTIFRRRASASVIKGSMGVRATMLASKENTYRPQPHCMARYQGKLRRALIQAMAGVSIRRAECLICTGS